MDRRSVVRHNCIFFFDAYRLVFLLYIDKLGFFSLVLIGSFFVVLILMSVICIKTSVYRALIDRKAVFYYKQLRFLKG